MKKATLNELAALFDGKVVGNGEIEVFRLAPTNLAAEGDITFVTSQKYLSMLESSAASAVMIPAAFEYDGNIPRIETDKPYLAFAKVQTFFMVEKPECKGVSECASISPSAEIGEDVTVSPGCYIGENVIVGKGTYLYPGVVLYKDVTVGEDCQLHSGVVVREQCHIGSRVIMHPNVVIGADGFGFAPDGDAYFKIPQVGNVVIEDDVEIGACSCVDRGAMGPTQIKRGSKIDNLVQVAHNCVVGEDNILVSQVGLAGSTILGNHCTFGGQGGAVGHVKAGDNVTVVARGVLSGDTESNQTIAGFPMLPHKEWLKATSGFNKLPEMRKEISRLTKKIEALEKQMKES